MVNLSISLEDVDAARARVADLSVKIHRAVTRKALRKAGTILQKQAAANLRAMGHGHLAKQVAVSSSVTVTKGGEAKIGAKRGTELGRIGHLLEKGTKPHRIDAKGANVLRIGGVVVGRTVQHPGARPRPWLEKVIEEKQTEVVAAFEKAIIAEISKAEQRGLM